MMLSRVAERLYWMGRYLERAEDTARLIDAYSHLILDIPRGHAPGWNVLIDTLDAADAFSARYGEPSERNIIKFLLADRDNACSIRHSIGAARENVRTTRDVLPAQAWELVNELHLYVSDAADSAIPRKHRFEFLETVIACNQQLNGLILTSVTRDHALWFISLGQMMERADMTSRIVDVATAAIQSGFSLPGAGADATIPELPLLWANLLKSLSATAAYRRHVGPMLTSDEVVEFVLKKRQFPRSILHCLDRIEETIAQLKAPAGMLRQLRQTLTPIARYTPDIAAPAALHRLIDKLQAGLGELDEGIHDTWFARTAA